VRNAMGIMKYPMIQYSIVSVLITLLGLFIDAWQQPVQGGNPSQYIAPILFSIGLIMDIASAIYYLRAASAIMGMQVLCYFLALIFPGKAFQLFSLTIFETCVLVGGLIMFHVVIHTLGSTKKISAK
jgi:hypothetical protein